MARFNPGDVVLDRRTQMLARVLSHQDFPDGRTCFQIKLGGKSSLIPVVKRWNSQLRRASPDEAAELAEKESTSNR